MPKDWFPSAGTREIIGARPVAEPLVYFVSTNDVRDFPIKIGLSNTMSFRQRLSHLQTAMPYQVEALVLVPAEPAFERHLHDKFRRHYLRGEWYERCPEIMAAIEDARRHHPDWRDLPLPRRL